MLYEVITLPAFGEEIPLLKGDEPASLFGGQLCGDVVSGSGGLLGSVHLHIGRNSGEAGGKEQTTNQCRTQNQGFHDCTTIRV